MKVGDFMEIFTKAMENDLAYIIEHSKSLAETDAKGKTLLHYAVLGSADDVIDYLLNQEIDVNQSDYQGETPLFDCARKGKIKIAKKLLYRYAKTNVLNHRNESLLHLAAHKGDVDFIVLLLENGVDVHTKTSDGKLAIHYAILAGHTHLIPFLIDQMKISWFYTDTYQNTFLHYAAQTTNHFMIDLFLEQNLDPNALNDQFETPLFHATRFGTVDTVLKLLKKESFIEIYNRRFETPIAIAKFYEQTEIYDAIIRYQETPAYQKLVSTHSLILNVLNRDHQKLKENVQAGCKMHKNSLKLTALDYAVKYKFTVCVNILRTIPII